MEYQEKWRSGFDSETCRETIEALMAEVPVFRFVSKLSSGGAVTRVLQAPETELPYWGRSQDDSIRLVQNIASKDISPYQPIVHFQFKEVKGGTEISVLLRPHEQARMFAIFESVGATLCIIAGLVGLSESPMGGLTIVFGFALAFFPKIRSRGLFSFEKKRCLEGLKLLKSKIEAIELEIPEKLG